MSRSWNKFAVVCAATCVFCCTAVGQHKPKYNSPAPPLALDLVQAPSGAQATSESLKGQAVVLEFWATWCAGCVAQIPHFNSMAESFEHKPVRFISVTDEDRGVVNWFLSKRPITGWVALDKDGRTFRNYGILGRPRTILIDANGTYRGEIAPRELTTGKLNELLAGTLRLPEPVESTTPVVGTELNAPSPLVRVLIRAAMSDDQTGMSPGAMRQTEISWEAWGLNLRRMLSYCADISEVRVVLPEQYENPRYDILISLPNANDENRRRILQEAIETMFGAKARRETRETDVYVLRRMKGEERQLAKSEKGKSVASVARFAEGVLRHPVLDESGVEGKFNFVWAYTTELSTINAQLKDGLGLELVPERRPIEVLVFEPNTSGNISTISGVHRITVPRSMRAEVR